MNIKCFAILIVLSVISGLAVLLLYSSRLREFSLPVAIAISILIFIVSLSMLSELEARDK
ncbi:MAG: hypothetical protein DRN03_01670 [Thermoplasmata archaeon]|nr:MAG: hypothetical protein DRN03_01670 [Thermoplasmata archaeon]